MGNKLSTPKSAVVALAACTAATVGAVWYLTQRQTAASSERQDDATSGERDDQESAGVAAGKLALSQPLKMLGTGANGQVFEGERYVSVTNCEQCIFRPMDWQMWPVV